MFSGELKSGAHTPANLPTPALSDQSVAIFAERTLCEAPRSPGTDSNAESPGVSRRDWLKNVVLDRIKPPMLAAGTEMPVVAVSLPVAIPTTVEEEYSASVISPMATSVHSPPGKATLI